MQPPREIELKLECDIEQLPSLARHPRMKRRRSVAPLVLEAAYFDTPTRALRDAGLTLRVRREDRRWVQTLKAGSGAAGLFDRSEWEWEVSEGQIERDRLESTPAARVLEKADEATLERLFSTVVERTTKRLRIGGSQISVTLDAGRIESGSGNVALVEVELELERGSASDLFTLARELGEAVPFRLGVLSKGERGYALIEERLRRPSKAEPLALAPEITAGEAFAQILGACLKQLRLNEDVFLIDRDAEALHQMRVALRRLRSAFTLFKPMLAEDLTAETLRQSVKRITEPFGIARNLDVYLEETLPREGESRPDEPGLDDLRARLSTDRDRAHAAVIETLDGREWRALLIELAEWIAFGEWRSQAGSHHRDRLARDYAAEVLTRFRKRLGKRGRHFSRLSPDDRHQVRIEAKKLRYGAEFFGTLFEGKKARQRHRAFVGALSKLQDHLGALNDLNTAHGIAAGLAVPDAGEPAPAPAALFAAGLITADAEAGTDRIVAKADECHEELMAVKPFWR